MLRQSSTRLMDPAARRLVSMLASRSPASSTLIIPGNSLGSSPHSLSRRCFSDNLMGYSPMAPSGPTPSPRAPDGETVKRIPTAAEVTTAGGVWAPTSAKRDKLGELRVELKEGQATLDDAASPQEVLDLYLADGLRLIAQTTDTVTPVLEESPVLNGLSEWMVKQQTSLPEFIYDEGQLIQQLTTVTTYLDHQLLDLPSGRCFSNVREFFDPSDVPKEEWDTIPTQFGQEGKEVAKEFTTQDVAFEQAVLRYRLLLTRAAVEHLKGSWNLLTQLSDADVDRAAVRGEVLGPQVVSLPDLYKFIFKHAAGTCSDRVDAAWALLDRDNDGLLDESEMNQVTFLCLAPVQAALTNLFEEALAAAPVRVLPSEEPIVGGDHQVESPPRLGWRQRRLERRTQKQLKRLFAKTIKNHFEDEVEINHRLRCIYAWAEKEHQGNRLDSVLVDEGWTGRKRYVELSPKISLPEFREVQAEHFTHLDRMGKEILKSFREDLWVQQGTKRQNRELMKDCFTFLAVVSLADYVILLA